MYEFVKNFFAFIYQYILSWFIKPYTVKYIEDPADELRKKTVYIIGTRDEPWQVEFLCPCGCGDRVVLPVNDSMSPRWKIHVTNCIPSLSPSIWRRKNYKSHFFIKKGRIICA